MVSTSDCGLKTLPKQHANCPTCRREIDQKSVADFYELPLLNNLIPPQFQPEFNPRSQNDPFNQHQNQNANLSLVQLGKQNKPTTKKDLLSLLQVEGYFIRRVLSACRAHFQRGVSSAVPFRTKTAPESL